MKDFYISSRSSTSRDPYNYMIVEDTSPNGIPADGQALGIMKPIGKILDYKSIGLRTLIKVKWLSKPSSDKLLLYFNMNPKILVGAEKVITIGMQQTDHGLVANGIESNNIYDMLKNVVDTPHQLAIVDEEYFDIYQKLYQAVLYYEKLVHQYPIYSTIAVDTENGTKMMTLLEMLQYTSEESAMDYLTAFEYSGGYIPTLKSLAERILESVDAPVLKKDLMTQEQQVEAFIEFSKLVSDNLDETVSDEFIDKMKSSPVYESVTQQLTEHGFKLSDTQQFNVFQQVGYFSKEDNRAIFNLSDMGSGKTLMTVESIYMLDLKLAYDFLAQHKSDIDGKVYKAFKTPNKALITPKLSVVSSWISTFELFYDVEKVSDTEYNLSFTYDDYTFTSTIHVAPFTVKSNRIHVDETIQPPKTGIDYLIVDEVHQLVTKPIRITKFMTENISVNDKYKSFILSGTLSNLTTTQWLHMCKLFDLHTDVFNFKQKSADAGARSEAELNSIKDKIQQATENMLEFQHRYFDPQALTGPQMQVETPKMTNVDEYFHNKFSSKIVSLKGVNPIEQELSRRDFTLKTNPGVSDVPNFELFYAIVGDRAITAQSTQIAEELFGEQKTQHNSDVIKTKSNLTHDDIQIIKALHKVTADYNIYKSQIIANKINNAILNLNDGLQKKNIYEILQQHAASNTRFLEYLSTLDIDILEKLPESNLLTKPKLEETSKFAILKDILASEPDETHLIVVNDFTAMKELSDALGIESMSYTDTKNQLAYQDTLDAMFEKQSVVIVPQEMIKSSLDLVQANRLIQYQLNSDISDIIQTQNRINRIGQTRETKAYYIATDVLQENLIELFLETYRNIKVAHKGIVELFVDMSSQVNVVNDYIGKALKNVELDDADETEDVTDASNEDAVEVITDTVGNTTDDTTDVTDTSNNVDKFEIIHDPVGNTTADTTDVIDISNDVDKFEIIHDPVGDTIDDTTDVIDTSNAVIPDLVTDTTIDTGDTIECPKLSIINKAKKHQLEYIEI